MAPKITATIDHLTEHEFGQIARAGAGSRYEVVLDYTDGDHHELEAHFRLVELAATRAPELAEHPALLPREIVTTYRAGHAEHRTKSGRLLTGAEVDPLAQEERQLHPMRVMDVGSTSGGGPEFAVFQPAGLVRRLSEVIGQLVRFSAFDARRLGIEKREGETAEQAVERWLKS